MTGGAPLREYPSTFLYAGQFNLFVLSIGTNSHKSASFGVRGLYDETSITNNLVINPPYAILFPQPTAGAVPSHDSSMAPFTMLWTTQHGRRRASTVTGLWHSLRFRHRWVQGLRRLRQMWQKIVLSYRLNTNLISRNLLA